MNYILQPHGSIRGAVLRRPRCRQSVLKRQCSSLTRVQCQAVKTAQKQHLPFPEVRSEEEPTEQLKIDKPENIMDSIESVSITGDTALQVTPKVDPIQQLWNTISTKVPGRMRGLLMLNVMTLIMSTNFVVVKDAEALMDPFSFSAFRFIAAAIPFLPLFMKAKPDKETLYAGAELGIWSALAYLTQGVGLLTTDASRISFLSALTVILVPIIVGLSGKGVSKTIWASAATAMLGVCLLSGTGMGEPMSGGDLLGLASAACFAMQIIRTEHHCRILPAKSQFAALGVSLLSVAICTSVIAGGMHADSIFSSIQHLDALTPQSLISSIHSLPAKALLFTGFISTDIVLLIEFVALKDVESTDAAIVYTMEPVLGAMWAYLLLGERWGPSGWIGAALILASSFATQVCGSRPERED